MNADAGIKIPLRLYRILPVTAAEDASPDSERNVWRIPFHGLNSAGPLISPYRNEGVRQHSNIAVHIRNLIAVPRGYCRQAALNRLIQADIYAAAAAPRAGSNHPSVLRNAKERRSHQHSVLLEHQLYHIRSGNSSAYKYRSLILPQIH